MGRGDLQRVSVLRCRMVVSVVSVMSAVVMREFLGVIPDELSGADHLLLAVVRGLDGEGHGHDVAAAVALKDHRRVGPVQQVLLGHLIQHQPLVTFPAFLVKLNGRHHHPVG